MTNTLLLLLVALVVLGAVWALLYGAWELWRGWRESSRDVDETRPYRRLGGPRL